MKRTLIEYVVQISYFDNDIFTRPLEIVVSGGAYGMQMCK